jgi:hypothetical protein
MDLGLEFASLLQIVAQAHPICASRFSLVLETKCA